MRTLRKQKAWDHAHTLMNHLTLYGGQDPPEYALAMREKVETLQDMNLSIAQIEAITDAILLAYRIGKGIDLDTI